MKRSATAGESGTSGMLPRILKRATAVFCLLGIAGSVAIAGSQSSDTAVAASLAGLAYDPVNERLLKAEIRALYVSPSGRDWSPVDLPSSATNTRITSIAAAEDGAWYVAGEGMGVLRSADGGKTWTALNDGLPHPNITALATHATLPETIYAVLGGEGGIYRSEDAGRSWKLMDKGPRSKVLSLVHSDMAGSMQTGWLFAGTDRGVRRAMDCFCLWRPAGQLEGAVHSITFDPREPGQIYAADREGLQRSVDGGQTWERRGVPGKIAGLAFTPSGVLYAVTQEGVTFRSNDGAQGWEWVDG